MSNAHDEAETHETQDSIFDKALDYEVLLRLNHTKRIDMKISIDITGIGNSIVRDNNGNLLPYVWTRQSIYNEFENATLLTREALQKHLQSFLDLGIKENEEMLQKVKDPAVLGLCELQNTGKSCMLKNETKNTTFHRRFFPSCLKLYLTPCGLL